MEDLEALPAVHCGHLLGKGGGEGGGGALCGADGEDAREGVKGGGAGGVDGQRHAVPAMRTRLSAAHRRAILDVVEPAGALGP